MMTLFHDYRRVYPVVSRIQPLKIMEGDVDYSIGKMLLLKKNFWRIR